MPTEPSSFFETAFGICIGCAIYNLFKKEQERCKVPDFALAIGHAEKWKLHNNCK